MNEECPLRSSNPPAWPGSQTFPIVAMRQVPYAFVYLKNETRVRLDLISQYDIKKYANEITGHDYSYNTYIDRIKELLREVYSSVVDCNFNTVLLTGSFFSFNESLNILNEKEENHPDKRKYDLNVILEAGYLYNSPGCAISALKRYVNENL